eukprot:NODE_797_length_1167_cov_197.413238_g645_i0.p1 GENE.NODE_797_length_1167_cov_197.413238_g645_i0~~NODE_797_length_1167_cov_197.413238_g645_i0.p1  ORF type:complete len:339 (+),score=109.70 NODE_797_length_1167_cov_197.413238_g645_i0:27-1019(+)
MGTPNRAQSHELMNWLIVICALLGLLSVGAMPTRKLEPVGEIPVVGLGTCCGDFDLATWLLQGNRHIDTSIGYAAPSGRGGGKSQVFIAEVLKQLKIPREEVFITTKVNRQNFTYDLTVEAFNRDILGELNTTYIDLALLHWPGDPIPPYWHEGEPEECSRNNNSWQPCRVHAWQALIDIQKAGKVRAIGVSNFEIKHIKDLVAATGVKPALNQCEYHPYWHQDDLVKYCNDNGIVFEAYAPFGNNAPTIERIPVVQQLVKKYNRTYGQINLKWQLQMGVGVVIPRTSNATHMKENVDLFDWSLSEEDVAALAAIDPLGWKRYPKSAPIK